MRQIFSQSVQGLRSSDIPKIAISYWLAASPLQQCGHCRATLIYEVHVARSMHSKLNVFRGSIQFANISHATLWSFQMLMIRNRKEFPRVIMHRP